MTKQLKGSVVENYAIPDFNVKIEIRLHKPSLTFFAIVGTEELTASEATTLKAAIRKRIEETNTIEWKPMIAITQDAHLDREEAAEFKLGYERFYMACINGKYHEIDWFKYNCRRDMGATPRELLTYSNVMHAPTDDIKTKLMTYNHAPVKYREGTCYRPYTEELWLGLERLRDVINLANTKIGELIGTNEGIAILTSGGKLLLTDESETRSQECAEEKHDTGVA